MKLSKGNLRSSGRFYFDDNNPDDGWVDVRLCAGADYDAIVKACSTKQPPEYRRGQRFEVPPKIDEQKQAEMLWDFMITGWGVIEMDGEEFPCTRENKIFLMRNSVQFARAVGNAVEALSVDPKAGKEIEAKNS